MLLLSEEHSFTSRLSNSLDETCFRFLAHQIRQDGMCKCNEACEVDLDLCNKLCEIDFCWLREVIVTLDSRIEEYAINIR